MILEGAVEVVVSTQVLAAAVQGNDVKRPSQAGPHNEAEESNDVAADTLPNQGTVQGDVPGTPPVDAGKQGKHVSGHNNNPNRSQWPEGQTGVNETQQGWQEGTQLPYGTKVWESGRVIGPNGETGVRVHIDGKGNIHGYPVNPRQYLPGSGL